MPKATAVHFVVGRSVSAPKLIAELRKSLSLSFKLKTRSLPTACCPSGPSFPTAKAPIEGIDPYIAFEAQDAEVWMVVIFVRWTVPRCDHAEAILADLPRYFSAGIGVANATTVEEIHRRKELLAFEEEGPFLL